MMALNTNTPVAAMQNLQGIVRTKEVWETDWMMFAIILPLVLYAIVISVEKFPAGSLGRIVYSNRLASNAYRNRSHGSQIGNTLLAVNAAIGLSTLGYFLEVYYDLYFFSLEGTALWFLNLAIIVLSAGLRFLLIFFIGALAGTRDVFNEYAFNILQLYKFLGIPLLLINFFIPFFDSIPDIILYIISFALIGNLLIIRVLRLASVFIKRGVSLLYFILYLCALEFIPILVFIKYLAGAV